MASTPKQLMKPLYYVLIFAVTASHVTAQYPDGCACPEECDCIPRRSIIDCSSQGLSYVPREINSCAWPGVTTVYVWRSFCIELVVRVELINELHPFLCKLYCILNTFLNCRDLSNNVITDVHNLAFSQLANLTHL